MLQGQGQGFLVIAPGSGDAFHCPGGRKRILFPGLSLSCSYPTYPGAAHSLADDVTQANKNHSTDPGIAMLSLERTGNVEKDDLRVSHSLLQYSDRPDSSSMDEETVEVITGRRRRLTPNTGRAEMAPLTKVGSVGRGACFHWDVRSLWHTNATPM